MMRSLDEWHQYLHIRTGDTLLGMLEMTRLPPVHIQTIDDGTWLPLHDEPEFREAIRAIAHRRISEAYTKLHAMEPELKDVIPPLMGKMD